MSMPWDVPPPPFKGDDKIETTYLSIGRALSTWEWFEGHFAIVFCYFLRVPDSPNNFGTLRAYGSVIAFSGRADMLKVAAESYLATTPDNAIETAFNAVYAKATKLAARRNEIAHGMVQSYDDGQNNEAGYVLAASYYATSKRRISAAMLPLFRTMPTYEYSSVEIDHFEDAFRALYAETMELLTLLVDKSS